MGLILDGYVLIRRSGHVRGKLRKKAAARKPRRDLGRTHPADV